MTHTLDITINSPQETVFKHLVDIKNRNKWWPACKSIEHTEGKEGEEGAKYKVTLDSRGYENEVTETITRKKAPTELTIMQESSVGVGKNRFYLRSDGAKKTKLTWESEIEMNDLLHHISAKIMTFFVSNSVKKPIQDAMEQFKHMVEELEIN